jgi:hypothetical protein
MGNPVLECNGMEVEKDERFNQKSDVAMYRHHDRGQRKDRAGR